MADLQVDLPPDQRDEENACSTSQASPLTSPSKKQQLATREGAGSRAKKSQDLSLEFVSVLSNKIEELEKALSSGSQNERESAKQRRKQLREILKYLGDKNNTVEDRINFIQSKYTSQLSEFLRLEKQLYEQQSQNEATTREKDRVQVELKRTNLVKDKLEDICRQLQRENKDIIENHRRKLEEDAKQREVLQQKFQQAIQDVSTKMDQQQAERLRQLEENDNLRDKLNSFLQQFETFNQLVQKKDLELQLAQARFEQQSALAAKLGAQVELLEKANAQLMAAHEEMSKELADYLTVKQRAATLQTANTELKQQLEHYYEKFAEFQGTLTKSNEMFDSLKKDIETQTKMRATIMRERDSLKGRCDQAERTILQLVEERTILKKQVESQSDSDEVRKLRSQNQALERLCRALQAQVKAQQQSSSEGVQPANISTRLSDSGEAAGISTDTGLQETASQNPTVDINSCSLHEDVAATLSEKALPVVQKDSRSSSQADLEGWPGVVDDDNPAAAAASADLAGCSTTDSSPDSGLADPGTQPTQQETEVHDGLVLPDTLD